MLYRWLIFSGLVMGAIACANPKQSAECAQYVSCVRAFDAKEDVTTNAKRFEPDGACWGGVEGAALCTRACAGGLEYINTAYTDPPEVCQ